MPFPADVTTIIGVYRDGNVAGQTINAPPEGYGELGRRDWADKALGVIKTIAHLNVGPLAVPVAIFAFDAQTWEILAQRFEPGYEPQSAITLPRMAQDALKVKVEGQVHDLRAEEVAVAFDGDTMAAMGIAPLPADDGDNSNA